MIYIKLLFFVAILVGLDQFTKYLAVEYLQFDSIPIIPNVLELSYVENKGAAFGILKNKQLFFIIVTFIILILMMYYFRKIPLQKRFNLLRLSLILIIAGAIGNLIDRIYLTYVVDFIYFKLINFPVFNIADSYVSIGAFSLCFLLIFVYKDEELIFIRK